MTLATTVAVPAPAEAAPAAPFRALDTRSGAKPAARSIRCAVVIGRGGVPSTAKAVAVNLTVVNPAGPGFATAYAKGSSRPGTSTINYSPTLSPIANNAIVKVGSSGQICVYTLSSAHIIIDVTGWFASQFTGVQPFRTHDSRNGTKPGNRSTRCVKVAGTGGVPSTALAVAVNVAAVQPTGPGFFTVYPRGQARPGTSNLNYATNQTISNGSVVRVGTSGQICVYTLKSSHVIVDVTGYFLAGKRIEALAKPKRVYDSRNSSALAARTSRCVSVRSAAPSTATAVFANLAVVSPQGAGFATLYASRSTRPYTSSINYSAGVVRANGQMVPVGTDGNVCIYSLATTHFVLDIQGYDTSGRHIQASPAQVAIDFGLSQVGTRYVGCAAWSTRFGAVADRNYYHDGRGCGQSRVYFQPKGTVGYDCSGLMVRMFEEAGIDLPHTSSRAIKNNVPRVDKNNLRPGDMLAQYGHVAMYIGNGQVIESTPHATNSDGSWNGTRIASVNRFITDSAYTAHRLPGI
jgi:cell wall-associated NlpC family hydrolase